VPIPAGNRRPHLRDKFYAAAFLGLSRKVFFLRRESCLEFLNEIKTQFVKDRLKETRWEDRGIFKLFIN
jgi:hypothetical protein